MNPTNMSIATPSSPPLSMLPPPYSYPPLSQSSSSALSAENFSKKEAEYSNSKSSVDQVAAPIIASVRSILINETMQNLEKWSENPKLKLAVSGGEKIVITPAHKTLSDRLRLQESGELLDVITRLYAENLRINKTPEVLQNVRFAEQQLATIQPQLEEAKKDLRLTTTNLKQAEDQTAKANELKRVVGELEQKKESLANEIAKHEELIVSKQDELNKLRDGGKPLSEAIKLRLRQERTNLNLEVNETIKRLHWFGQRNLLKEIHNRIFAKREIESTIKVQLVFNDLQKFVQECDFARYSCNKEFDISVKLFKFVSELVDLHNDGYVVKL